jgi:hypothetical protein
MSLTPKQRADKKYRETHREQRALQNKEWASNNKDKTRIYGLNWYYRNLDSIKLQRKERLKQMKLIVVKHYNPLMKCVCCGEDKIEFLTLDHIEGGGNKLKAKLKTFGSDYYRWLINNNFPHKLRVLCMNCNWAIGKYGYCPHNNEELEGR